MKVWKPSSVIVTRYSPGASGVITPTPASVVCLTVATPVAMLVAVTVAPGSAAFELSSTVPWMEPLPPICARAGAGANNMMADTRNSIARVAMTASPFRCVG
jgi:hypothetical protein